MPSSIPFTEFFCGIGGLCCCLSNLADQNDSAAERSLSFDINELALQVHRLNFSDTTHQVITATIESLKPERLMTIPRKLWWMSPPCQPYTRRGMQRDWEDPRTAGLKNMIRLIEKLRPDNVAMENVPGFATSDSRKHLVDQLHESGYSVAEATMCPSQFGYPNRRQRFYLIAAQQAPQPWRDIELVASNRRQNILDQLQQPLPDRAVWEVLHIDRFKQAVDIVSLEGLRSGNDVTSCFTSAYGRSPVRSGSYLRDRQGVRFFTPKEILALLGFPSQFQLPDWPAKKLWPLVGNTLSLPVVRYVLSHLPI